MGKSIQFRNDLGTPLYPNTISDNVYIDASTKLSSKIIKNIFLVNKYKGTDYEKIQQAIDECTRTGGGLVVLDGDYEVSNTIVINADYVNLVSYTSSTIYLTTEDTETALFRVISSATASGSDATCNCMQGFTIKATNSGTGIGIIFGSNTDEDYTSRDIKLRDMVITNFNIGVTYRKNAYLISIADSAISSCKVCVQMLVGYSNYGERILFTNTTLCNSTLIVEMSNTEGIIYFTNCSMDYSTQFIKNKGGNIFIDGSHLEFRNLETNYDWLIYCGNTSGHGSITIRDSALVCTNPENKNYNYLFMCDSGTIWQDARFSILVDSCRIINWRSKENFLCGGNDSGLFKIKNTYLNQVPSVSLYTKRNNNLAKRLEVLSYDDKLATVEFINQEINGEVRRVAKVTKTTWLGYACTVKLYVPNLTGSINSKFCIKREGSGTSSCWASHSYRYNNLGNIGSIEIKPNSNYINASIGHYLPSNLNLDDYVITLDLSNGDTGDIFYLYIDSLYEF